MRLVLLLSLLVLSETLMAATPSVEFPTAPYRRANEHLPALITFDGQPHEVSIRPGDGSLIQVSQLNHLPNDVLEMQIFSPSDSTHLKMEVDGEEYAFEWPKLIVPRSNERFLVGLGKDVEFNPKEPHANLTIPNLRIDMDQSREWSAYDARIFYSHGGLEVRPIFGKSFYVTREALNDGELASKLRKTLLGDVSAARAFAPYARMHAEIPDPPPEFFFTESYIEAAGDNLGAFYVFLAVLIFGLVGGIRSLSQKRDFAAMYALVVFSTACMILAGSLAMEEPGAAEPFEYSIDILAPNGRSVKMTFYHAPTFAEEDNKVLLSGLPIVERPPFAGPLHLTYVPVTQEYECYLSSGAILREIDYSKISHENTYSRWETRTIDNQGYVFERGLKRAHMLNDFASIATAHTPELEWQLDYWLKELFVNGRNWKIHVEIPINGALEEEFEHQIIFTHEPKE